MTKNENQIIAQALEILESRLKQPGQAFTRSDAAIDFFKIKKSELEQEIFSVAFLDSQHRLIACEEMFKGTIDKAAIYPREVAKKALSLNAAATILAHNHPSGIAEPSQSDRDITDRLVTALSLFDIRVLDHIVIGGTDHVSFANRGLL